MGKWDTGQHCTYCGDELRWDSDWQLKKVEGHAHCPTCHGSYRVEVKLVRT